MCSKMLETFQDLIETDGHECATIIVFTCTSQICIGVIIDLSIKTQSLCNVLIDRDLNEIMPTAIGGLDIL